MKDLRQDPKVIAAATRAALLRAVAGSLGVHLPATQNRAARRRQAKTERNPK